MSAPMSPRRRSAVWRRGPAGVLGGVVVAAWALAAVGAPILTPYGSDEQHLQEALQPPSVHHLGGTDDLGRDILARVLYGGRYTLTLALSVVVVAGAPRPLIGGGAGFLGGGGGGGGVRAAAAGVGFSAGIL